MPTKSKEDTKDTAPLETPPKPLTFTVKLEATHAKPENTVCGFTYPDGDGFGHWSLDKSGYEMEFASLSVATSFMTAAIATGGLVVAADSPTKLKE
jgi:hypothetical protein